MMIYKKNTYFFRNKFYVFRIIEKKKNHAILLFPIINLRMFKMIMLGKVRY